MRTLDPSPDSPLDCCIRQLDTDHGAMVQIPGCRILVDIASCRAYRAREYRESTFNGHVDLTPHKFEAVYVTEKVMRLDVWCRLTLLEF